MPLKKYNTASSILANLNPASAATTSINQMSPSPSISASTSPSPPEIIKYMNSNSGANIQQQTLANQMSSLVDAIEKQAAVSVSVSESSGSASDTIKYKHASNIPSQIKSRLYALFCQIEHEFDLLYAENMRLSRKSTCDNDCSNNEDDDNISEAKTPSNNNNMFNTLSSTTTLVPNTNATSPSNKLESPPSKSKPQQNILTSSMSIPSGLTVATTNQTLQQTNQINSLTAHTVNAITSSSKSALFSSKARINNLSFPKFKPNAREFIMQSLKNTSAQIVNKTQNNSIQTKLQNTLTGHTDGIWDINVQPVPNHLINNNNFRFTQHNTNLLIGTASADSTARLWYLNSQLGNSVQSSPSQNHPQLVSNGFCVQQYCGHSGSVNSIRFHPRFFTDATNLILTASGDCQAHIWQSVLSPTHDSLESTSDVLLNYSNCYSIATSLNNQTPSSNNILSSTVQSPLQNPHYQELVSNIATIRSPIKRFEGHTDTLIAAEWFPDGELLATGSWDRSANIYNVETGKILCNLQHDDYLTNVNIHRSHKIILTSSKDCTFKVWDFRDPICSVNVYQGHNRAVNSAIFVNEDKIATSSDDQTLKLWDLRIMRSPLFTISVNSGVNRICTMNASMGSETATETFLCLPLDNRDIKIYNLHGERVIRLPRNNQVGHRRLVTSLASYGNLLLSASFDKQINCWSFDYNSSKTSKVLTHNKENDQINTNDQHNLNSILSPVTPSSNAQIMSPLSSKLQQNSVPPPLAHITNNTSNSNGSSSKGINTLSKFIKI